MVDDGEDGVVNPATHPGHPTRASAGGAEYERPDHPGIFSWSPASLIIPPVQEGTEWLSENARLDVSFRAAFGFQQATSGPGNRTAASQDYRVAALFRAINWEEGKQGWAGNVYTRFEFRDKIGDIAPYFLNTQIGALATTTYGQDEHAPAIVQLYWEQFLFDGAFRLRVGKLDPDDYFNLGRFADDYRYFDHTLFSAFPASNHPSGGLGFNLQWYASEEWTVTAGLSDVQGRKTLSGFDTFFGDGDFFYGLGRHLLARDQGIRPGQLPRRHRVPRRCPREGPTGGRDRLLQCGPGDRRRRGSVSANIDWSTGRSTGVEVLARRRHSASTIPFNRQGDAFGIGSGIVVANDKNTANDMEIPTEIFYRWQLTERHPGARSGYQIIIDPGEQSGRGRDRSLRGPIGRRLLTPRNASSTRRVFNTSDEKRQDEHKEMDRCSSSW
jgi:hypothetical protein